AGSPDVNAVMAARGLRSGSVSRAGRGVPAGAGLGEEAQAGPFGELGEHVAGLDAERGREVLSCPVASGLAGHDAGDLVSSGVGRGPGGWSLRPRGSAAGRSEGGAKMVTSTRVIPGGSSGRSWTRRWYLEVEHFTFRAL